MVINKRRRNVLKDLIKVISQELYEYRDPVTDFLYCLFVDFDFQAAQDKLALCEEVREAWLALWHVSVRALMYGLVGFGRWPKGHGVGWQRWRLAVLGIVRADGAMTAWSTLVAYTRGQCAWAWGIRLGLGSRLPGSVGWV
mgnify:CR=1 FL=1